MSNQQAAANPSKDGEKFHSYPAWAPRFWQGMRLSTFLGLLIENRFAVRPSRWGLVFTCLMLTTFNSVIHKIHWLICGGKINRTKIVAPPIFIIGHWRSGTTYLHELMVEDQRFGFPTTYECFAPHHSAITQGLVTRFFSWLIPSQRPMDNMSAGWDRPQEDEFALCNLGAGSNYRTMAFPKRPQDLNFLDFVGVSEQQLSRWKASLHWFLQMITYRCQKQIVLKSPPHTGRIRVLAEMYPGAKFIHIVRDPHVVYTSTIRLWKSLYTIQAFQNFDPAQLQPYVIECFNRMCGQFEKDKHLIPADQLCELRYEDLVANPLAELQRIYQSLSLGDFETVRPRLEAHLAKDKNYQTNRFEISSDVKAVVAENWSWYAEKYGYSLAETKPTTLPAAH